MYIKDGDGACAILQDHVDMGMAHVVAVVLSTGLLAVIGSVEDEEAGAI